MAGISVKNSSDFFVGAFLWLKLVEFALFYFYLKIYAIRKFNFVGVLYALILGGVFQAFIAIGQFLKQGDLGLRWLGESVLGPHMTGIASFYTSVGDKVIRAYGTTPHPNILAAYLFLAIVAFYFVYIYHKNKRNEEEKTNYYDTLMNHSSGKLYDTMIYHIILKYWWMAVYPTLLFGLFFTFSRTIIFLWGAGFLTIIATIAMSIRTGLKAPVDNRHSMSVIHRLAALVLVTFVVVGAFSFLYWPEVQSRMTLSAEEEAVRLRVFYNEESLKGGINLFGIGLGDFTGWLVEQNPNLPSYMYQPVHNIYLLIYSEVGVVGFVLFLLFIGGLLYEFVKKVIHRPTLNVGYPQGVLLVVASILFIGLFDHFFLTLQQGRFVFWIALALLGALAPSLNKHKIESGGLT